VNCYDSDEEYDDDGSDDDDRWLTNKGLEERKEDHNFMSM
jgi:hypothetical protein